MLNKPIEELIKKFKEEYGEDAKLEDGDEIVGVCKDGVITLTTEGSEFKVKVVVGEPYHLKSSLNLTEER